MRKFPFILKMFKKFLPKQVRGVEPPSSAWEADVLPMNHTCMCIFILHLHCLKSKEKVVDNSPRKTYTSKEQMNEEV